MNLQVCGCQSFFSITRSRRLLRLRTVLAMLVLACIVSGRPTESQALQGRVITGFAVAINPATHKAYAVNEDAGLVSVPVDRTTSTQALKVGHRPTMFAT